MKTHGRTGIAIDITQNGLVQSNHDLLLAQRRPSLARISDSLARLSSGHEPASRLDVALACNAEAASGKPIAWQGKAHYHGVTAKIIFAERHEEEEDFFRRELGFLDTRALTPVSIDDTTWYANGVFAKPDAVLRYHNGYIAVEYKSMVQVTRSNWRHRIRRMDMYQVIIAAWVLANSERKKVEDRWRPDTEKKTVACLLRFNNAAVLLVPMPSLIYEIQGMVADATRVTLGTDGVTSRKLAEFADFVLKQRYPNESADARARSEAGHVAHAAFARGAPPVPPARPRPGRWQHFWQLLGLPFRKLAHRLSAGRHES